MSRQRSVVLWVIAVGLAVVGVIFAVGPYLGGTGEDPEDIRMTEPRDTPPPRAAPGGGVGMIAGD